MLASSKSGKPTQLTRTKDTVKTGVLECQTMGCGQSTVAPAALEHEMPQHSEVKTPVLQEENTAATVATNSPHSEWLDQQSGTAQVSLMQRENLVHVLQGSGNKAAYH